MLILLASIPFVTRLHQCDISCVLVGPSAWHVGSGVVSRISQNWQLSW